MKNTKSSMQTDLEDIILWPDGWFCYRYELHEYSDRSDDYLVHNYGTKEYTEFLIKEFGE